jgi:anti-sigma-K factor RskA
MDEPLIPEPDREALAAELALGLLDGQARADALRLRLGDPAFAALVEAWEAKLSPLYSEWPLADPGGDVWNRIDASLPDAPGKEVAVIEASLRRWRTGALISGAVAAALALVLLVQPAPAPLPAAPQLAVARIESAAEGPVVLARYDRTSGVMRLQIAGIDAGALAPELWVIPVGGDPVSLGQIGRAGTMEIALPAPHRPLLQDGAMLAITMEPVSAKPHAAPNSAPVATGKIITI